MTNTSQRTLGKVYLVGAGPGDPGLLTLRGAACLARAELVLHDYLVNPATLAHAPASAEIVSLGHHAAGREMSQEDILARMIDAARHGKNVVRLKGGDPVVFGRGGEEIDVLRAAGIAYEVVPGVSAALAAAGYAEIPVTHGRRASAVALVTGRERSEKGAAALDYAALARFPGTLIFYMGVRSAAHWSQSLLRHGMAPDTPVAIVRRCTWPDQTAVRATLGTVAAVVAEQNIRAPAVIVVGEAAGMMPEVSWFAARPLFGISVLVSRPAEPTDPLAGRLAELGAEVLLQPAIRISDPPDWRPVDAALARLDGFDWLVFSSVHGVRYLLGRLWAQGGDARRLGRLKLAAIGPGTAAELEKFGLRADLVPAEFRAESLAEALSGEAAGRRLLLARASRGRQTLAEGLAAAGAAVEQVVVYSSTDVERPEPDVAAALLAGRIDWVTVTSSAIARSLAALFGDDLRRAKLASLSPVTSGVLAELGFEPAVEAAQYTIDGLVSAIVNAHL